MKPRNVMAKVLADPRYRKRVERKQKGKASYTRNIKHKDRGSNQDRDFSFQRFFKNDAPSSAGTSSPDIYSFAISCSRSFSIA